METAFCRDNDASDCSRACGTSSRRIPARAARVKARGYLSVLRDLEGKEESEIKVQVKWRQGGPLDFIGNIFTGTGKGKQGRY